MCQWFILNGISKTFCFGFIRFFRYIYINFGVVLFFPILFFLLFLSVFIIGALY